MNGNRQNTGNAVRVAGDREGAVPEDTRIHDMGEIARKMVRSPDWLNLRAACVVAAAAGKFGSNVLVTTGSLLADAKSVIELLALGVEPGETIEVMAEGEDATDAVRHLTGVIGKGCQAENGTPLAASLAAFDRAAAGEPQAGTV